MELLRRRPRERVGGSGDPLGATEPATGTITVISGPYMQQIPVPPGGLRLGEVRQRWGTALDLAHDSLPVVNGREVAPSETVRPGQTLIFTHRAGEKG